MGMIFWGIDTDQRCTMFVQKKKAGSRRWMVLKKMQLSPSVVNTMEKFITFSKVVSSNRKLDAECEGQREEYLLCFGLF